MTKTADRRLPQGVLALLLVLACIGGGAGAAGAREAPARGPSESPVPAETAAPPPGADVIAWYPAPSRCAYFTPEDAARFRPDRPETWRFRFLVLAASPSPGEAASQAERGYVMKDGLLRELEKVRSGLDADGANVTVWRSAGEPRLNITTTLRPSGEERGAPRFVGTLATIRGDGRDTAEITGRCAP